MSDAKLPAVSAETAPQGSGQEANRERSVTPGGGTRDVADQPPESEESAAAQGEQAQEQSESRPAIEAGAKRVFCVVCGAGMERGDLFCHACGWDARVSPLPAAPRLIDPNPSDFNRLAALLLCLILGFLGIHRFYVGKVGTGVLWLCTLGFLGVGQIVDLILIATGEFRDSEGRRVLRWSEARPG